MLFLYSTAIAVTILQAATGAPRMVDPKAEPEAYAVYSTLLHPIWKVRASGPILVQRETERAPSCAMLADLTGDWAEAVVSFQRENARERLLQPSVPMGVVEYQLVSRAEIKAHDSLFLADTSQPFPRPGVLEHVAVSAIGFNVARTKALVYLWRRLANDRSHVLGLWELKDGRWVHVPKSCGGSHG